MENYIKNYRRNKPNNNLYESLNYFNQNEQVVASRPANAKDWCAIRNQIAYILGQAELDWIDPYDVRNPGRLIGEAETNPDGTFKMIDQLEEYWSGVRGTRPNPPTYQNVNPRNTALASARGQNAWSAAFVSWAMRTASVEESDGFAFSMRHITYVVQALSNARKNDALKPIWLLDTSKPVEVGDILCFNRVNDNGVMSNHTLNGLARLYLDANNNVRDLENVSGVSHCDVVKEIIVENNRKFAVVVGGNKRSNGTVASVRIRLNNNNTILNPATVRNPGSCFGIIDLGSTCAPRITNTTSIVESEDESLHQPFFTNAFFFRRNANNPNTLNVIFEGDSWLDYPIPRVLDLYDTISNRNQSLNLNSLHLAKFGETTSDMFNDKATFVQYISNYRIDRIYFSGGGNDVFPQLGAILNPGITRFSNNFFTDQSKLDDLRNTASGDELFRKCILYKRHLNTQVFENALFNTSNLNRIFNTVATNYLGFGSIVNSHSTPNTVFYMHTYDYPLYKLGVRPSLADVNLPLGPWIKPVFDRLQINDEILRCYIIIRLLDKFYYLLNCIKSTFVQRRYQFQTRIVDYRGLLNGSEYWRDEIHPNSAGATRLSARVNF